MPPESKRVSLETAKRMKEAGFPQDTEWVWCDGELHRGYDEDGGFFLCMTPEEKQFAAPDAQEIGEELPKPLHINSEHFDLHVTFGTREEKMWSVGYANYEKRGSEIFDHQNEAEARAAVWLWIHEKSLLNDKT